MSAPFVKVSDVCEQIRGVSYSGDDAIAVPEYGYLAVLRANNITDDGLSFEDLTYVPEARISAKQLVIAGDVVIAASSGSLSVVGKAAPAMQNLNMGFGAFCKVLRPNSKVDHAYFAHFFKTRSYRQKVSSLAAGANINNLRNEHLDDLPFPLPPLEDQRRIAAILDQAETLRTQRRTALTLLDSLTQSLFLDMFGDPANNPMSWETLKVEQLAEQVTDGEHLTPKREPQGVKLLSARNIRDGYIDFQNVDFVGQVEHERIKKRCNPVRGDVLISCSGSIGRVASVETDEPFSLVRSVAMIRPKTNFVLTKFLEYYLRTPAMNAYMIRRANASSQANLFQGPIREMPVTIAPLPLQQTFATRIAAIEALKATHRRALAALDALFASLQQRAFAGGVAGCRT